MADGESSVREDYLPSCGYKIYQDSAEFTFTTDSLFLAYYPHLATKAKVAELGCGTGAVGLCAAARGAGEVTGIDINPRTCALFERSIRENGLERKVRCLNLDIRDIRGAFKTEAFDLVLANPPYGVSGRERIVGTAACHEKTGSLEDFFAAAAYLLHSRGRFALVQRPERFAESMYLAQKYDLAPIRLTFVHGSIEKSAWIFLMEMVKAGKGGLEIEPPLVMYDEKRELTPRALRAMGMENI